jgi:H+/Cl- antiporter ClcA
VFAALALTALGCALGARVFLTALDWVTATRLMHPWLVLMLPVAGALFGLFAERVQASAQIGTSGVLTRVRDRAPVPRFAGGFALVGTLWTHLFGGSAGREGTAVQMGASIAETSVHLTRINGGLRSDVVSAGVAAGFGAVFGTPIAGAVFAVEMAGLRTPAHFSGQSLHFRRTVLSLACAVAADRLARLLGVQHADYGVFTAFELGSATAWAGALGLGAFGFLVAHTFLALLALATRRFKRMRLPLRMAVGGLSVLALSRVLETQTYLGLGLPEIASAFRKPEALPSFAWKLLFTVLTASSGFVGGEVTPLFFMGAHLGSAAAAAFSLSVSCGAALGMSTLFGIAAGAPLTGAALAAELFGISYAAPALAIGLLANALAGSESRLFSTTSR